MSLTKLSELKALLAAKHLGKDVEILGYSTDTRMLKAGDLFIALTGDKFDGHKFVKEALAKGAVGAVIDAEADFDLTSITEFPLLVVKNTLIAYGQIAAAYRQSFSPTITAITGSCGKTTVKSMLAKILQQAGKTLASAASFNNEVGVPFTLLQLNPSYKYAVLEMGARNINDISYLMQIVKPQISLVTNIAPCHLETFKDLATIAQAKGKIYANLAADGIAIINADESYAGYWQGLLRGQQVISFGIREKADVTAKNIKSHAAGTSFELCIKDECIALDLPVIGQHQVMNALAAAACASAQDISLPSIAQGLVFFEPIDGRGRFKQGYGDATIIDDSYNANPASVKAGLEVLVAQKQSKKIFVMGDMLELGDNSKVLHHEVGEYAQKLGVNYLLAFGELSAHAVSGFGKGAEFYSEKKQLVSELSGLLDANTAVLVKGSNGMRLQEIVEAITPELATDSK